MTRRLLVALDPDTDTAIATQTALAIAARHGGEVTGLAFVDVQGAEKASAGGGIGSMYYAERMRDQLTTEMRTKANELVSRFVAEAEAAGVPHTADRVSESGILPGLLEEMASHDLLVAGRESHFDYASPARRTHTLARAVEHGASGTLVVGQSVPDVRRVLVAYDGSTPAARALQRFCGLAPFGRDLAVTLLHVHGRGEREASARLLGGAEALLRAYGFAQVEALSEEGGRPAERIAERARDAGLIVSGAYAAGGIKKFVFGSTASRLLADARIPLFLYH